MCASVVAPPSLSDGEGRGSERVQRGPGRLQLPILGRREEGRADDAGRAIAPGGLGPQIDDQPVRPLLLVPLRTALHGPQAIGLLAQPAEQSVEEARRLVAILQGPPGHAALLDQRGHHVGVLPALLEGVEAALPSDHLFQAGAEALPRPGPAVARRLDRERLGAVLDEELHHAAIVLEVALRLSLLHLVQRGLRDEQVAVVHNPAQDGGRRT